LEGAPVLQGGEEVSWSVFAAMHGDGRRLHPVRELEAAAARGRTLLDLARTWRDTLLADAERDGEAHADPAAAAISYRLLEPPEIWAGRFDQPLANLLTAAMLDWWNDIPWEGRGKCPGRANPIEDLDALVAAHAAGMGLRDLARAVSASVEAR